MNLNRNPTKDQLRELLRSCDDDAGHHIVWVDRAGEVRITLLDGSVTPAEWATKMEGQIQFRYETRGMGNRYVGSEAAEDSEYVELLFRDLVQDWQRGAKGYVPN